jgi:hypothetical protein
MKHFLMLGILRPAHAQFQKAAASQIQLLGRRAKRLEKR